MSPVFIELSDLKSRGSLVQFWLGSSPSMERNIGIHDFELQVPTAHDIRDMFSLYMLVHAGFSVWLFNV